MQTRETGQRRHLVIQQWVVLHRAGTERIELERLRKVQMRQPQKVAQHLRLVQLRKSRQGLATKIGAENVRAALLVGLTRSKIGGEPARRGQFENQRNFALRFLLRHRVRVFMDWNCHSDFARRRHHAASANAPRKRSKSFAPFISVTEIKTLSLSSG